MAPLPAAVVCRSFVHRATTMFFRISSANLVPAYESLHFLEANGAIVVGIHCFEDALVRRLKLLK
jgi:hypothetical protein